MSDEVSKKPKFERKPTRKSKAKSFDPEKKAKVVMDSKLPDSEKAKYLDRLGIDKKEEKVGMPFAVYAKVRKISPKIQSAMKAYPKAKDVQLATAKQWDEIFKEF